LTRFLGASTWAAVSLAEVRQRVDRLRDLALDQAAHLEHAGRDAAEFGVELAGEVLFGHVFMPFLGRLSRSGR
jgi:hypothetical protein